MLNPNEQYARKNPIRATISNAGASIYHASNLVNESLQAGTKVAMLASNALDILLLEQQIELAQTRMQLEAQATTKFSDL